MGVIEIINIEDIEKFKEKNFPSLSILSDYAAIAIENSQYLKKIQNKFLKIWGNKPIKKQGRVRRERKERKIPGPVLLNLPKISYPVKKNFCETKIFMSNFKLTVCNYDQVSENLLNSHGN